MTEEKRFIIRSNFTNEEIEVTEEEYKRCSEACNYDISEGLPAEIYGFSLCGRIERRDEP